MANMSNLTTGATGQYFSNSTCEILATGEMSTDVNGS